MTIADFSCTSWTVLPSQTARQLAFPNLQVRSGAGAIPSLLALSQKERYASASAVLPTHKANGREILTTNLKPRSITSDSSELTFP
jgi:hypothetical protein